MKYIFDDFVTYYKFVLDKKISRNADIENQVDVSMQKEILNKLSQYTKNKKELIDLFPEILNFNFSPSPNNYKISWISGYNIGKKIKEDLNKLKIGEEFYIISPYIGDNDFSDLSTIIMSLIEKGVQVKILTTFELQDNKKEFFKKFIKFNKNQNAYFLVYTNGRTTKFTDKKINFYIIEGINLHSKIYIINNTIYVGSSNFTGDGFYSKLETINRAEFIGTNSKENVKTIFIEKLDLYKEFYNTYYSSNFEDCQEIGKQIYKQKSVKS
ncbi:hypothetical protein JMUB3935_1284 [Leptotrichia trevisanii]|uniref:PLD phosphodiesterase domain-containing protein n=1 Tax=Leptotrichia trevisanii TaxID=109328 RepID=A0A510K358_9FUSO|nr:phospholipase D-like domain-containing protein [Leptotrichia trevisanii]BBM45171.1 hypothetical protein JMUB3870_1289 [Leptotrichia trevisanii]BBM52306.1 hypothetical protein JMUB3935_1284 [Leptotrichia trevisanii]